LTVSPAEFEGQLEWLARHGYTPVRVADWAAWRARAAPLPPRPVLLTFDDGYADLAEHAFPALERRGWPAVVFVVTRERVNRWDGGTAPLLAAEQLREWNARGIEVGGHSRTHVDLTRLGPAAVRDETGGCREDLQSIGIEPVAFAYPYGCFNADIRAMAAEHFPLAFTTGEGMNGLWTDPARHARTPVLPRHPLSDFRARVRLGWSPRERALETVARIVGRRGR
jgi:peptidoglycan/xylan/chitin deacetylase (PgdA/CDA1 family)